MPDIFKHVRALHHTKPSRFINAFLYEPSNTLIPSCDVVDNVPTVISAVSVMAADVTAAILLSICDCVYPDAVVKTP